MKRLFLCMIAAVVLLGGCAAKTDVVMKVGDVEVKQEYIDYFQQYFNNQSGGTVSEAVTKAAKNQATLYAKYGALGHVMRLEVKPVYDRMVAELIGEDGNLKEFLEKLGISNGVFEFVMYGDAYRELLLENCKNDKNITTETEQEYFKNNYWRAKHLLLMTQDKTADEQAEVKKKIDQLYTQVKNGADFDALINEYNEDPGVKTNPDGYVFTYNEMVSEFQDGVTKIDIGEYNLVKTSYGYHIVQRLALDETEEKFKEFFESKKQQIDSVLVDEVFMDYIDSLIENFDIKILDYMG